MLHHTLAAAAVFLMGGCSLRVSNPTVSISRADLSQGAAELTLRIDNPNGRSLRLAGIDYTLTDGVFPMTHGSAKVDARVPDKGSVEVPVHIPIDPPLASPPAEIELRGELLFRSGALGFAEVSRSPFTASRPK